jgi:hypothetical protein
MIFEHFGSKAGPGCGPMNMGIDVDGNRKNFVKNRETGPYY